MIKESTYPTISMECECGELFTYVPGGGTWVDEMGFPMTVGDVRFFARRMVAPR